jgi:hypothetical protein
MRYYSKEQKIDENKEKIELDKKTTGVTGIFLSRSVWFYPIIVDVRRFHSFLRL